VTFSRLPDHLERMLAAAQQALSYVDGFGKPDFIEDKRTQQAVVLNLILIGEEATKVLVAYPDFAHANAHIPWRSMKGMRNRIAHGYFEINLDTVWDTVQQALPALVDQLQILQKNVDESGPPV
jgi:uncharacterized protein with HEPN domain